MATQSLLPDPACLMLDGLSIQNGIILFAVRAVSDTARCPLCGCACDRVHSRYPRTLLDLPWQGNTVQFTSPSASSSATTWPAHGASLPNDSHR
jgi:transposase